jgi:uncharacterized membrane protein
MPAFLHEWLNVVLRWAHVIAAIMWVGDSFLFVWLDQTLARPREDRPGDVVGELWLTHSGGFYEVVKHRTLPGMPPRLWWFMWQSYATWITGMLLLTVVYALGGRAMLLDAASTLPHGAAVALLFGTLLAGVALYELLCRVPGLRGAWLGAVALPLVAGAAWALAHVFTPRAAYLLVGATVGTIMASNVFFTIIPGQKRMVAATRAGLAPDPAHGARAKARSTHNHYLTLPVLFTMLSNHFPGIFGGPHAWAALPLVFALGAGVKLAMNLRERTPAWVLAGTFACLGGAVALTLPPGPGAAVRALSAHAPVSDPEARLIVQARCVTCHSAHPSNAAFTAPPNGVTFESADQMRAFADRIVYRVVDTRTMPLGNLTGITDAERVTLGAWAWQQNHAARP